VLPASGDYVERPRLWFGMKFPPTAVLMASHTTVEDPAFPPSPLDSLPQTAPPPPYLSATPVPDEFVPQTTLQARPPDGGVVYIDPNCKAYRGPYIDIVAESILWRLEHTSGQPVVLNPVLGQTTRTDDLDLGLRVGPRVNMSYLTDEMENISAFEVGYFSVDNWNATTTLVAPGGTFLRLPDTLGEPGVTTDFSGADSMRLYYESRLNSLEMNVLFGDPLASFHMIFGPRFIQLEERFNIDSFTGPSLSNYEVTARDELLGIQLGGRWRGTAGYWEFNSVLKIGVYHNKARLTTLLTDDNRTVVLRNFGTGDTLASFVLDGGVNVTRPIGQVWLIRVGYSVFVMDEIARAADQFDFSDSTLSGSRNFYRQDAVAHGLNVGLEARW